MMVGNKTFSVLMSNKSSKLNNKMHHCHCPLEQHKEAFFGHTGRTTSFVRCFPTPIQITVARTKPFSHLTALYLSLSLVYAQ